MDNYIGEIRLFPFSQIPKGWVACSGQSLSVNSNQALYSLVGNIYGGNNVNFNLPNLNGTVIVSTGISKTGTPYQLGNAGAGGEASVALVIANMPAHNHLVNVAKTYDAANATNEYLGNPNIPTSSTQANKNKGPVNLYATGPANTNLNPGSISNAGGGVKHENMQPYMALTYCIATTGYYPPHP